MDDDIRVYPTQTELTFREKPPPTNDSDAWRCAVRQWGVDIYLHNRAKRAILQHAYEAPQREVGGVLVGGVYRHPGQGKPRVFIEITDAVQGDFTSGSPTSLTFTPDTWSQAVSEVETRFPEQRIVGWYHTHPGHGVFLSEPDKFIQNNFFHHSGQLALVIDHINTRAAFFIGSEKEPSGIQKASEFTWDDVLYRSQVQSPHATTADNSRVQTGDYSTVVGDAQTARPEDVGRPPQRHGRIRRLLGLLRSRFRKKESPPPVTSEQETVLRIDLADLYSPEVQRRLEQRERTRHRPTAYSARYADMASRSGSLAELVGCAPLEVVLLLLVTLITLLLVSILSPWHKIPLLSGISVLGPMGIVFAVIFASILSLVVLLMLVILSGRP